IDLEGLRSGSIGGMFFGIDRARYLARQLIGGPRQQAVVAAAAPSREHQRPYLVRGGRPGARPTGGELPSEARAVGAGLDLVAGEWIDSDLDRRFRRPTSQELYDEIDRFHPPGADSTWGEWHYFNLAPTAGEWWYLTYLIGGKLS